MPKNIMTLPRFTSTIAFVLGSGESMRNYTNGMVRTLQMTGPVIGVNNVAIDFPCNYNVRKSFGQEGALPSRMPNYNYKDPRCKLVISEYDCGGVTLRNADIAGDYYFFTHQKNRHEAITEPLLGQIIVSYSTITSAIHFAAYMGARTIFVFGHDGEGGNYDGYEKADGSPNVPYEMFVPQTEMTVKFIKEKYDATVIRGHEWL